MTPIQALLSAFLAAIAVGGFGYVFLDPLLSGERKAEKRQAAYTAAAATRKVSDKNVEFAARRKQVADSLKEIERRNARKRVSLDVKISRAGLHISRQTFFIYSALSGLVLWRPLLCLEPSNLSCRRRCSSPAPSDCLTGSLVSARKGV